MTIDQPERRKGLDELKDELHALGIDVAVIKSDAARQATMRRLLWGMTAFLVSQTIIAVFGYGRLTEQINQLDLNELETDVRTALVVIADHGTEIQTVRTEQQRVRGVIDSLRNELKADLVRKTADRFHKRDWEQAAKPWITEKFENLNIRIQHLEDEHHGPSKRK